MIDTLVDFYINPNRKILGEDARMFGWWDKNYATVTYIFEDDIPDIDSIVETYFTKEYDDPNSLLRVRIDKRNKQYYYTKIATPTLYKRTVIKVKKIIESDIIREVTSKKGPAYMYYTNNTFSFCINHQFFDGINAFNILQNLFDADLECKIQHFRYLPLITESMLIPSIPNFIVPVERALIYEPHWKLDKQPAMFDIQHGLEYYKGIKRSSNSKISFTSVVAAYILSSTFEHISHDYLAIGVLVAFNTACRFNNYGIITAKIKRRSPNMSMVQYAESIHHELNSRKEMAGATYIGGNVYNSDLTYGSIDILLSGFPMTTKEDITINGVRLKRTRQYLASTTAPIYCMFLSCNRSINFSFTVRAPEIDVNNYRESLEYGTVKSKLDC